MDVPSMITELAATGRDATEGEIRQIREYVAERGFDQDGLERVRGRGAGVLWRGRPLRGRDTLPPAEAHYVRHVLAEQEWPEETSFEEYLDSVSRATLDERNSIFLSRYQGMLQVGFISRSERWKGAQGGAWILVEFRQARGHITTAFQFNSLEVVIAHPDRSHVVWLTKPP